MIRALLVFVFFFSIQAIVVNGQSTVSPKEMNDATPPRIIRVCCAFGADMALFGIPFKKINHITSLEKLGHHEYMGHKKEGNGLIYTQKGGFIDIAHLRDQADWTKYLYELIKANHLEDVIVQKLGYEGGKKFLSINPSSELDSSDYILLAGKMAYDLSLWHELSTWYGASAVPMMPERYSSFSVEDVYSNLLGVYVGMEAIKSDLPYNEAVTKILLEKLDELDAVETEEETYAALEAVRNVWWTNDKRLPSEKVILQRDTEVFTHSRPWLVPDTLNVFHEPHILDIPLAANNGKLLTNYYSFSIDLNFKFPVKQLFPERATRQINQDDFEVLMDYADEELNENKTEAYFNSEITSEDSGDEEVETKF